MSRIACRALADASSSLGGRVPLGSRVDRKIGPDEIVIADQGPSALLEALERALRKRLQ